jgi:hypothetical protein
VIKSLLFALAATTVASQPTVTLTRTSEGRAGWYNATATVPVFKGNALATFATKEVAKVAEARRSEFRSQYARGQRPDRPGMFEWKAVVSVATDPVISLYGHCETYTGGAHGNRDFVGLSFAVVDGKPKRLRLADLMEKGADPVAAATELVIPRLKKMGADSVVNGGVSALTPGQADNFVITPSGLTWLFSPYEMGPYSQGPFFVKVPWSEMQGKITLDR